MDEKKTFIQTLKDNKETIIRRTLLVAGVVGGIAIATIVASAAANKQMIESFESDGEDEFVILEPVDTPVES